jgi:pilus assembly protein Flp/PilA
MARTLERVQMIILRAAIWKESNGQDLIEYALLAAAVAVGAGAMFPTTIMPSVSTVFSKVSSCFQAQPS